MAKGVKIAEAHAFQLEQAQQLLCESTEAIKAHLMQDMQVLSMKLEHLLGHVPDIGVKMQHNEHFPEQVHGSSPVGPLEIWKGFDRPANMLGEKFDRALPTSSEMHTGPSQGQVAEIGAGSIFVATLGMAAEKSTQVEQAERAQQAKMELSQSRQSEQILPLQRLQFTGSQAKKASIVSNIEIGAEDDTDDRGDEKPTDSMSSKQVASGNQGTDIRQQAMRKVIREHASSCRADKTMRLGSQHATSSDSSSRSVSSSRQSATELLEQVRKNPREIAREFVHSWIFDTICGVVVLASTFMVGFDTNFIATYPGMAEPEENKRIHIAINTFFMVELCIRLSVDGLWGFFCGQDWRWNNLDALLVSTAVTELLISSRSATSGFASATGRQLRAIRLLRLLRTVRLFRSLRSVLEFRKMLFAIISSLRTFMCAMMMLCFVMYFFAVLVCSGVADFRITHSTGHPALESMYGTLPKTLYTLFRAVSNGIDWDDIVAPLDEVNIFYRIMLVVYITGVTFGVLNVVTSVFVESAVKTAQHYRDLIVDEKAQKQDVAVQHLKAVFDAVDVDHSGCLTVAEMDMVMSEPEIKGYLEALEINGEDTRLFFRLLDTDGSGQVEKQEFIDGCLRLRGDAKCIDVHALIHSTKITLSRLTNFANFVEWKLGSRGSEAPHRVPSDGSPLAPL